MTALVTGAGKRLGRAMALYLAQRGQDVAVHYSASAAEAEAVVAEIRAMGRRAVAVQRGPEPHGERHRPVGGLQVDGRDGRPMFGKCEQVPNDVL